MTRSPRYELIRQDLAGQIADGSLGPGSRIASETELAELYGVSRMTARQAVGELESAGLVVRRRGAGTFVQSVSPVRRGVSRLGPLHEELGVSESEVESVLVDRAVGPAPDQVSAALGVAPKDAVVHLRRLRRLAGRPIAIQDSWIPLLLAPSLARDELIGGSLYRTLSAAGVELTHADQEVSAMIAEEDRAALLGIDAGDALTRIRRITYGRDGVPVEFAVSATVADLPLTMRLERFA